MKRLEMLLAIAMIVTAGCADPSSPPQPGPGGEPPSASPALSDELPQESGTYMSEEEWKAAGSLVGDVWVDVPTASLVGYSFDSRSTAHFRYVNVAYANLKATLTTSEGAVIDSADDPKSGNALWPRDFDTSLSVTLNTNGHDCGLLGRATAVASGGLKLVKTEGDAFQVWGKSDSETNHAAQLECETTEECSTQTYYSDGSCNESGAEPESLDGDSGGDGGDGGGEGGGAEGECEDWVRITYRSEDGGQTWYEVSREYFTVCY